MCNVSIYYLFLRYVEHKLRIKTRYFEKYVEACGSLSVIIRTVYSCALHSWAWRQFSFQLLQSANGIWHAKDWNSTHFSLDAWHLYPSYFHLMLNPSYFRFNNCSFCGTYGLILKAYLVVFWCHVLSLYVCCKIRGCWTKWLVTELHRLSQKNWELYWHH